MTRNGDVSISLMAARSASAPPKASVLDYIKVRSPTELSLRDRYLETIRRLSVALCSLKDSE